MKVGMAEDVQSEELLTWPAVSIISVANSFPLYLMTLLNVFSIVG